MKILVTGNKGYIGAHLAHALVLKHGLANVFGFDESEKREWDCEWKNVKTTNFDVVIHCGANSQSWYAKEDIFWCNYQTTKEILEYCLENENRRLIYFSSCAALNPFNWYGWSKRTSADLILNMDTRNQCTVVYPYQIFGREVGRPSGFSVPTRILRGEISNAFDPWFRDYLYVADLVRMIDKIIDDRLTGEYDLGTGVGVTSKELFHLGGYENVDTVGPGSPDYPPNAPPVIIARKDMLVPGVEPTVCVKDYMAADTDQAMIFGIQ